MSKESAAGVLDESPIKPPNMSIHRASVALERHKGYEVGSDDSEAEAMTVDQAADLVERVLTVLAPYAERDFDGEDVIKASAHYGGNMIVEWAEQMLREPDRKGITQGDIRSLGNSGWLDGWLHGYLAAVDVIERRNGDA